MIPPRPRAAPRPLLPLAALLLLSSCADPAGRAGAEKGAAPPTRPSGGATPESVVPGGPAAGQEGAAAALGVDAGGGSDAGPSSDAGTVAPEGSALSDAGSDVGSDASTATATAQPFAPDNKILPPLESEDLTARARGLFEAIAKNDPSLGESFWFPKEPFIPLKDVKDSGKYWDQLHATYVSDIRKLHRKRKSWDGAKFVSFQVGSTPKWVPPGDEGNKIGYYRTFRGKLRYEIDGESSSFEVRVMISWQGRWFITHLLPFKKSK